MSEDSIRGRNLVESGRFPDGWEEHWKRRGTQGGKVWQTDPMFGHFLLLNGRAVYVQSIATPSFSEAQFDKVEYRVGCQYENWGEGGAAKIVLKPANGEEDTIDLSGIKGAETLAEWRPYLEHPTKVLQTDETIDIEIHGSDKTGSAGLRTTDFDIQVHLPALELTKLKLDNTLYQPSISTHLA
jgi:hypothetical protein